MLVFLRGSRPGSPGCEPIFWRRPCRYARRTGEGMPRGGRSPDSSPCPTRVGCHVVGCPSIECSGGAAPRPSFFAQVVAKFANQLKESRYANSYASHDGGKWFPASPGRQAPRTPPARSSTVHQNPRETRPVRIVSCQWERSWMNMVEKRSRTHRALEPTLTLHGHCPHQHSQQSARATRALITVSRQRSLSAETHPSNWSGGRIVEGRPPSLVNHNL
jgi:hypothetical protein